MKYIINSFIVLIAVVLMTSCYSSMRMTVDVFDHLEFKESLEYKQHQVSETKARLEHNLGVTGSNKIVNDVEKRLNVLISEVGKDVIAKENRTYFLQGYVDAFKSALSEAHQAYYEALVELDKGEVGDEKADFTKVKALEIEAESYLRDYAGLVESSFLRDLKNILEANGQAGLDLDEREISKVIEKFDYEKVLAKNLSTSFGGSISSDRYASLIAKAPGKYWRKYKTNVDIRDPDYESKSDGVKARYNKTAVRTFFGNADIAVKMESPGSFTVKGVRMDAGESIKTSFKVLNQGIKYLTYASGIPISNTSQGEITGTVPEEESLDLTSELDNELKSQQLNEEERAFQRETAAFMAVLRSQSLIINGDDADNEEKKRAILVIKKAYAVYKKQLNTE
ncbi:hypothetical protein KZP23_15810 [Echinicola marina]|uniref:hypothetical protein n=1 Tax=Echinicola marina TaxID=2859768 RepID=UPI001CF69999|nr:hypothetical protein [Echinicola marina]UCS92166.1 hypothetical protein KZP23_15810 [Echinicola marina]